MAACTAVDLGVLAGGVADGVNAINDSNQVVGFAIFSDHTHAFLAQPGKALRDLGSLAGKAGGSVAVDINSKSQVIGYSTLRTGSDVHAFLWTSKGGMKDLGTLGGTGSSNAADINNKGQIVGWAVTASGTFDGFLWTNGVMQDLGPGGAVAVNELGHVAGTGGNGHAYFWTPSQGFVDLGTLGGTTSSAVGINDNDEVTGYSYTASLGTHAFRWAAGVMTDLGALPGGDRSIPRGINSIGQIVGFSDISTGSAPFFWSVACGLRNLTTAPGGEAKAINSGGKVVGTIQEGGFSPAALWPVGSGCSATQTLLPSLGGGKNDQANAINSTGVIAGSSFDWGNTRHVVVWQGCP